MFRLGLRSDTSERMRKRCWFSAGICIRMQTHVWASTSLRAYVFSGDLVGFCAWLRVCFQSTLATGVGNYGAFAASRCVLDIIIANALIMESECVCAFKRAPIGVGGAHTRISINGQLIENVMLSDDDDRTAASSGNEKNYVQTNAQQQTIQHLLFGKGSTKQKKYTKNQTKTRRIKWLKRLHTRVDWSEHVNIRKTHTRAAHFHTGKCVINRFRSVSN